MDSVAPVESQDEEVEVITYADAYSHGKVVQEFACFEVASVHALQEIVGLLVACRLEIYVTIECPHIAGIYKQGSIERAKEVRTIFQIHDKLHIAHVGEVGEVAVGDVGTARSDASCLEGAHIIGSAYIEILGIRCAIGIAIDLQYACLGMGYEGRMVADAPRLAPIHLCFDKL